MESKTDVPKKFITWRQFDELGCGINFGKDLCQWWVLSLGWKSKGMADGKSDDSEKDGLSRVTWCDCEECCEG